MINTNDGEPVPCDDETLLKEADDVLNQLRKRIQENEEQIEKDKKELNKVSKRRDKWNRWCCISERWPISVFASDSIGAGLYTFISGVVTVFGAVFKYGSSLAKHGGNHRGFDEIKSYLLNNKEALQEAQEKIGSTDINFISGYLTGDDSLSNALFASTGLREFLINNSQIATTEALKFGAEIFAGLMAIAFVPVALDAVFYKKYNKFDDKVWDYRKEIERKKKSLKGWNEWLDIISERCDSVKYYSKKLEDCVDVYDKEDYVRSREYNRAILKNHVEKATKALENDKELKR